MRPRYVDAAGVIRGYISRFKLGTNLTAELADDGTTITLNAAGGEGGGPHDHDGVYSDVDHEHDAAYEALGHNHNGTYEAGGSIATHEAAGNPHPAYALDTDLTAHEGAADPHGGYQKESEKDQASGYAGLNGSSQIADAQIPLTNSPASTQAFSDSATIGSGTRAARSDHKHAWPALGTTPSTQAFGDAAAGGSATTPSKNDHKHAMPANPVTAHEAAGDPHTGYRLESADHTHASSGAQAGQVAHSALTGLTSGDDHTQYQKESEKDQASGYAGLTAGSLIAQTQLGSGAADGTKFLRDDRTWVTPSSAPAPDGRLVTKELTSQQDSSSATPAKVTGMDQVLGIGTWQIQYFIRYRSSATATGVRFDLNHSGTVTSFVWNQRQIDASATAATAAPDQDNVQAASGVMGGFASRAKGTAGRGTTISVDSANADMLTIIECLAVVTVSGDLQLYFGSEATGSTQSIMPGSSVVAIKVSA